MRGIYSPAMHRFWLSEISIFNQFSALRKNAMAAIWPHLYLVQIENSFYQRTLVWIRVNSIEYTDAEFVVFLQTESADFREICLVQRNVISIHHVRNHLLHNWPSHNFLRNLFINVAHIQTHTHIKVFASKWLRFSVAPMSSSSATVISYVIFSKVWPLHFLLHFVFHNNVKSY